MFFHLHPVQLARNGNSLIVTGVVHYDNKIDNVVCDYFLVSPSQSTGGVVGGHHDNNFLAAEHRCNGISFARSRCNSGQALL
jgi:hypothetical protein